MPHRYGWECTGSPQGDQRRSILLQFVAKLFVRKVSKQVAAIITLIHASRLPATGASKLVSVMKLSAASGKAPGNGSF